VPRPADPRIDLLQATAAQTLPAGQELAAQAAAKANDVGARMTVADAKAIEGHLALLAGDFDRAGRSLAISEQLYSSLGNRNSLLEVLHDRYLLEWRRGASWTELDRILTSAGRVASELGGPSAELAVLRDRADHALWAGDLPGASTLLQGKLAPSSLGAFASGKLSEAARLVDSQLSATGSSTAHRRPQLLVEKGKILWQQGNLESAEREFQAAVEASQSLGAQPDLGNARVGLAAVAVEGARFSTAEQLAKGALDIFVKHGIALFEPAARIALARALLAQDRRDEAKTELERADQLARRLQLGREKLEVAILSARLDAASKKRATVESAVVALKKTASDAARLELKYQELLARQAMAEIEIVAGIPAGQAHWAALQQDAAMSGFGLFTRLEPPPPSQPRKPAAPTPYRLSKIKLE
jgi:tetratricopeptide (TPR) repeat protein